jgi:hypothetical protein
MVFASRIDPAKVIGRAPERLKLEEAIALAGQFVAIEIYTPEARPLRKIEAVAETPEDCIRELVSRGLDPRRYEITRFKQPF